MTRLRREMLKLKATRWKNLTFGEKVLKVILTVVKWTLILTVGFVVVGAAVSVLAGIILAFAFVNAIIGGINIAGDAYRPGDRYIWFR